MTTETRPGLSGLSRDALSEWVTAHGQPSYRARQIADAVWRGTAASTDGLLTLPAALREAIDADFSFDTVADTEMKEADGGLTEKALHRLADGALIESVLMHYPARAGSRERHTSSHPSPPVSFGHKAEPGLTELDMHTPTALASSRARSMKHTR